jgi:hypothetical protein
VMITCANILEKHTVSVFMVIGLVQVVAEVLGWKELCLEFGQ